MALIALKNCTVEFPVHNSNSRSFQLHLLGAVGGRLTQQNRAVKVRALDNINLTLQDGDRLGILGHNGAGKTTLLRVLAGAYTPSQGSLRVEGKLTSFTDITLGMDPEATGLDNIIFRCVFMGLRFDQAHALLPSIAEFSELGEYLKLPVRTYSSGMFLRLAFSISTATAPDIIVMDEMIGTGDAKFIEKAQTRLSELLKKTSILVLATHDAEIMKRLCNKVIWLEHGTIRMSGPFDEISTEYSKTPIK